MMWAQVCLYIYQTKLLMTTVCYDQSFCSGPACMQKVLMKAYAEAGFKELGGVSGNTYLTNRIFRTRHLSSEINIEETA